MDQAENYSLQVKMLSEKPKWAEFLDNHPDIEAYCVCGDEVTVDLVEGADGEAFKRELQVYLAPDKP